MLNWIKQFFCNQPQHVPLLRYSGICKLGYVCKYCGYEWYEDRVRTKPKLKLLKGTDTDLKEREKATDKYKYCNHHHEINGKHELVNFGNGEFVANKAAIPLLKALNECGLRTRTHHYDGGGHGFVSILLDENVRIEIKTIQENDAKRTEYNGKNEFLVSW